MGVHVIGDKDTVLGLSLVGATGVVVGNDTQASAALEEALANESIDLLLLTREAMMGIQSRVTRLRMVGTHPVILEIPGKAGKEPEESLETLIRRAIGISI